MGLFKEFRDFAMKGNVIDLAVAVIIGAAFGKIVTSLVEDVLMPPVGKLVGNLDFSNLYVSLSDKIDAANIAKAHQVAADAASRAVTQPATGPGMLNSVTGLLDTATRLPLAEAKKLGPVIAYGNFLTITINFIVVAFCIFALIKLMTIAHKRFEKEQAAAPPPPPTKEEVLLTEIRDLLKQRA